jgi:hypothetical protein
LELIELELVTLVGQRVFGIEARPQDCAPVAGRSTLQTRPRRLFADDPQS